MAALTLTLQAAVAVLVLGFGVLALRVAPGPGTSPRTATWFMAGVTFTLEGVVAVIHSTAAIIAMLNQGSPFYRTYLKLMPSGNDARSVLVLGFAMGLVWVLLLKRPWPSATAIYAIACALLVTGFLLGFLEPPVEQQRGGNHFSLISLLGAATTVLLLASLYRGMVNDHVDWLLWSALALYAAREAVLSNIQTVLAWAGLGGGWAPPPRSMMWTMLVSSCVMVACSLRRLAIARAGGEVPGLLERLRG